MKPHTINRGEDDDREIIAYVHPASDKSVETVMNNSDDLELVWVTLINGDRILGVFPTGDAYELTEDDARYPG